MRQSRRWQQLWGWAIAAALCVMLLSLTDNLLIGGVSASSPVVPTPEVQNLILQADEHFHNGDYARAEQTYQDALIQLQQTAPDSPALATVRANLARTYLLTQQYESARSLLEVLDASGAATPNSLSNLALAQFSLGDYATAEQTLTRVLTQWDAIRAGDDLDALDQITLFEQQAYSYELMQRTLVAQGKTDAALEVSERSRAQALVAHLIRQTRGDRSPTPLAVSDMRAIAREHNTTLVVYAALGEGRRILGNEAEIETDLLAWVISPQGDIHFQQTPLSPFWQDETFRSAIADPLSPLASLIQQTREALGVNARGLGVIPSERRVTDELPPSDPWPLRSLYELLIAPIETVLPDNPDALVTLIPQGPLFLVPFAALQAPTGAYLVDQHAIALAPSIQTLALTPRRDDRAASSLVVGNPITMPRLLPDASVPIAPLSPLPGAEQEAIAIAEILNTAALIREQATETAIVQQLPQQGIIHLATHGLLNLDSRLNEFGLPTDPDAATAADASVYVTPGAVIVGDNVAVGGVDASVSLARERVVRVSAPGVLALAPSPSDDGWLTATEIANLTLRADLVVLSACDTGRGRITGDGVIGLSRAFLAAGASTVVVSLWQVPDDATAALMVTFYEQLAQTNNKAIALQRAMQRTRQQFPDPRNWSAFVLLGGAA